MSVPRVRFRIWWLMVATAIVAMVLAWLDEAVAVALMGMVIIAVVPVTCSSPNRRFIVTSWTLALYPVMIPVYLYLTWLTVWCVLGHCPRPYLDDPKTLGPIVRVPSAMFFHVLSFDSGLVDCLEDFCLRLRHSDHRLVAAANKWPPAIDSALCVARGICHIDEGPVGRSFLVHGLRPFLTRAIVRIPVHDTSNDDRRGDRGAHTRARGMGNARR